MMNYLSRKHDIRSFSVCPENFTGEKGKAGMATEGTGAACARDLGQGWKVSPSVDVPAGTVFTMADICGMGAIKHFWITYAAPALRDLILRIYWDGSKTPSVEAPLGDFFASATSEYRQLNSLAVCVNPRSGLNCYWEMPYRKGFKMTLENRNDKGARIYYQIDCEEKAVGDDALYFHAQFRRVNPLPYKDVYTIVDGVQGNGQYVGTYLYWGVNNNGWWGEGEIKFYIDGDTDFPTICGTGTEDYFCGSYDFDLGDRYQEYSTPYTGLSKIDAADALYKANRRFNMYRWHIQDPIYFKEDLRVTIQALGWRSGGRYLPLQDDISSVAFWYSDRMDDQYPTLPDRDALEII
ncbi:MAG: DUF2961 domain-containing protein [Clostridia bacterium]|nr:DUF2961 domain-containing protein [Clostridia bacterium]